MFGKKFTYILILVTQLSVASGSQITSFLLMSVTASIALAHNRILNFEQLSGPCAEQMNINSINVFAYQLLGIS